MVETPSCRDALKPAVGLSGIVTLKQIHKYCSEFSDSHVPPFFGGMAVLIAKSLLDALCEFALPGRVRALART